MARPRNETSSDRDNQRRIISAYKAAVGHGDLACELDDNLYHVDYALFAPMSKSLRAYVEVKASPARLSEYGQHILSHAKYTRLLELSKAANVPGIILRGDPDGLHAHTIRSPGTYIVQINGRKDRGQIGDLEPVIVIPEDDFDHFALAW